MAQSDLQLDSEVFKVPRTPFHEHGGLTCRKDLLHAGLCINISNGSLSVQILEIPTIFSSRCTEDPCFMDEKVFLWLSFR